MRRPDHQTTTRTDVSAGAVLGPYLQEQAADFLRSLRLHHENSAPTDAGTLAAEEAAGALRRSARRISGTLHTFRSALEPGWAEQLRTELAWLSGTLAREHAYATRLTRLLDALHALSGTALPAPARRPRAPHPAIPMPPSTSPPSRPSSTPRNAPRSTSARPGPGRCWSGS